MTKAALRAPYIAAAVPGLALLASVARWLMQGSGNVYTAVSKRFYVPDPDLGWRIADDTPLWLGLEIIAALAGLTGFVLVAAWWVGRRERARGAPWSLARTALWVIGIPALVVPIWAFATSFGPADGRETLPAGVIGPPTGTIEGSLAGLPAGSYQVAENTESAVTGTVEAGGEAFEARFTGNLSGSLRFDPGDLKAEVRGAFRVDAASVDTGVTPRSNHARSDDFLDAEQFPEIAFELSALTSARQGASANEIVFWGDGAVTLMGKRITVQVEGTVTALDDASRDRLGLGGPAIRVGATFPLQLADSPLSPDDFDAPEIPIQATLIMVQDDEERTSGLDKPD